MSDLAVIRPVPELATPNALLLALGAAGDVADVAGIEAIASARVKGAHTMRRIADAHDRADALAREYAEVKLRAGRRGGELLEGAGIGPGRKSNTLSDFDIAQHVCSRWKRLASIPADEFEAFIAAAHAKVFRFLREAIRVGHDQAARNLDWEKANRSRQGGLFEEAS